MVSKKPFDFGKYGDDVLDERLYRALSHDLNDDRVQSILKREALRREERGHEPKVIQGYKADIGNGETTIFFYLSLTGVEMLLGEKGVEWQYHLEAVENRISEYLSNRKIMNPVIEITKLGDTSNSRNVVSVVITAETNKLQNLYSDLAKVKESQNSFGLP
jgi:hypothetical protein